MDLDAPAGDADLLDHEPQQSATAVDVEVVERSGDLLGEAGQPAAQSILGRELGASLGERGLLSGELVAAGRQGGGAPGELVEVEQAGLVGVQQPGALALVAVQRGIEPSELSGDELVLVAWRAGDHGALAGYELPGVEQRLADLRPDVLVEFVGADVALGAATLG